jgi:hypothetical protein
MQKVEGSNPFIRFNPLHPEAPLLWGFLHSTAIRCNERQIPRLDASKSLNGVDWSPRGLALWPVE